MQLLNRQNFIAFALCALLSLATTTQARCFLDPDHHTTECKPPKEGLWRLQKYFPAVAFPEDVIPSDAKPTDFVTAAILDVYITEVAENVYNGTGIAETYLPEHKLDTVVMAALFDPESCLLSGTVYNEAVAGAIVFRLHSAEEEMSGPLIVTYDGVLAAPLVGFTNATLTK